MQEKWKEIKGYEGLYEVSDRGVVRNAKGKMMKQTQTWNGYMRVGLYKDGKPRQFSVHRLVAVAFVENPDGLPMVNHKDENRANNRAENLEWCTSKYNNNYGNAREKWHDTVYGGGVCMTYKGEIKSAAELAKLTGKSTTTIYRHFSMGQEHFEEWLCSILGR